MLTHVTQCGLHFLLSRLMSQQNIHKFSHVVSFKCSEVVLAMDQVDQYSEKRPNPCPRTYHVSWDQ